MILCPTITCSQPKKLQFPLFLSTRLHGNLHVSLSKPVSGYLGNSRASLSRPKSLSFENSYISLSAPIISTRSRWVHPICKRSAPICLFGGKGNSDKGNQESPWKSLGKAMGGLKKKSAEELLREQIQNRDFGDDEGGSDRPGGGGGGGGGGSFGDSDDEGFYGIYEEFVQVASATMAFIFLYYYILEGEEWVRLVVDYIRYLFSGRKSIRLTSFIFRVSGAIKRWKMKRLPKKQRSLEEEIVNTPTWCHNPKAII
ncbi:uncharacterized protein LOC18448764 [Amborella trichopoda]|uniref:Uncharacterized protein n=1 Tax=Amborella trichopoda TaxID=13333 RepID=U5DCT8_AMBTC|nr:uncharacterized protein LOC18448764 [Amborella trichopoda]ERN20354.1 hypothetical protein AMTR_s00066p00201300 [Amborella trichopoda]|eukprot:XP_006858887.1 uncharacterized protein LOC18448764 [Amborella trichopoda]